MIKKLLIISILLFFTSCKFDRYEYKYKIHYENGDQEIVTYSDYVSMVDGCLVDYYSRYNIGICDVRRISLISRTKIQ